MKNENPDAIICSTPEALMASSLCGNKIKIIYDAHEYYEDEFGDSNSNHWAHKTHNKFNNRINIFITVSNGIAKLYEKTQPGFPKANIIHNASPFIKQNYDFRIHKSANLPLNQKIVLFHGALTPYRGLENLHLIAEHLDEGISIVIFGDGPLKSTLKNTKNKKLIILDSVPYSELPFWISGANLGLLLYEPKSLNQLWCAPNKLFEYLACDIPILAYDLNGLQEFKDQTELLHLISTESTPEIIADNIVKIINNKSQVRPNMVPTWEDESKKFVKLIETSLSNQI